MPIRPIDRFVSALHRQHADELLLETGRPVRLRVGREERVILAQDVRSDQIELLLRDVLPDDLARAFQSDGELGFPYQSPTGPVLVRVRRAGERLAVGVSHYVLPAARAPAPDGLRVRPSADFVERNAPPAGAGIVVAPRAASVAASASPPPPTVRGRRQAPAVERMPGLLAGRPFVGPDEPVGPPAPASPEPGHSGDTGPIELDLGSTGNIPILTGSDVQALASIDIAPVEAAAFDAAPPRLEPTPVASPLAVAPSASRPASLARPTLAAAPALHKVKGRIDPLLYALVEAKGSDLHLTSGLAPRMRKDGDMRLVPGFDEPLESHTIEAWLMEIAPPKSRARFEASSDADYGYELPGVARLRVNAFRDRRGAGGVFRVIPAKVLTADQLGLPQAVRELTTLAKGLVLVTGPTGSGKSTTLAAMIDLANKTRADHIITIEDPVEFVHEPDKCLINQREVHTDTESFSTGLRAALREDPDIVLVGEMRDLETIAIAVETAETGHLVFGTLHTTTAVSTVDRIVDQFPADRQQQIRVMLSSALKGVVAQTLCRKAGGGRVAALEVLLVVPAVSNLIREAKTFQIPSIMQTSRAIGMQSMNDALFRLVEERQITADEALRVAVGRTELRAMLERANLVSK